MDSSTDPHDDDATGAAAPPPAPETAPAGVPESAPIPAPEPPTGAAVPPPGGYPPPSYSPPVSAAPARSGRVVGIVIGIVAAVVLVLGGLGVAIYFLAQNAITAFEETGIPGFLPSEEPAAPDFPDKEPLVTGEPGPTVAAEPTVCPDTCFTADDFDLTVLADDAYVALGVPDIPEEWTDYLDSTAQKEFLYTASAWEEQGGAPEECFPVTMYSPVAVAFDERPESADDPVGFTVYRVSDDQYSTLSDSPRLFTSSAAAEEHLARMLELIAGCSSYEMGTGTAYWTADVTPMPALDLPASVASVGWVEDSPFGRFYGADLQRGNLVLRTVLYTDGSISEEAWRDYLVASAKNLAALAP